ncbi:MAG: CRTAC1 family protein [Microthrixaceae bacterium]
MRGENRERSRISRTTSLAATALAALTALALVAGACSSGSGAGSKSDKSEDKNVKNPNGVSATADKNLSALLAEHGVPGLKFINVADQAGLSEVQSDEAIAKTETMTSGAAIADIDGDGYDDIFLTRAGRTNLLYLNNGDGTFTESARAAGVSGRSVGYGSSAAAFFDADGDGSLDLFVSGFGRGTNVLYINDGTGRFSDQTEARGVYMPVAETTELSNTHGVTIGDVNNDGHMDLLVLQWYSAMYSKPITDQVSALSASRDDTTGKTVKPCEAKQIAVDSGYPTVEGQEPVRSALYINDGSGNFTDQTAQFGLDLNHILAFTGVFSDIDGDGWADLAITGDGCTSRLFRNVDGKRFDDVTASAGVGTDENGMGSVIRDFNGDGSPDWLISAIAYGKPGDQCPVGGVIFGCSGNRLYLNDPAARATDAVGNIRFTDATDQFGLRDGGWGWGIAAEDFANSGSTQVTMTNGYDIGELSGSKGEPAHDYMATFPEDRTRFWAWSNKSERYEDIAEAVGIADTGLGHAVIPFDMDNDGDLDLLIAQAGAKPILYRNDTPTDRAWLTVRLNDTSRPGNSMGEGVRIEVREDNDSKPKVSWITTGGSYESQKPAELHLGFGGRTEPVARIDIFWPGASEPSIYRDVELNQKLTFIPLGSNSPGAK